MDITDVKYLIKHTVFQVFPKKPQEGDQYYIIHIPKAGGTSLRYGIYETFPSQQIYPNAFEFYLKNGARYKLWKELSDELMTEVYSTKKIVIGHYGLRLLRKYPMDNIKTIVFFRKPVPRIWSSIRYHEATGRFYKGMTFDEVIEKNGRYEGELMARIMGYDRKRPNLEEVYSNLSRLDFIGIVEEMDTSIELLNKKFDWNIPLNLYRNKSRRTDTLTKAQEDRLIEISQVDELVYRKAVELFESQKKQLEG